jgi:hypothetical protein
LFGEWTSSLVADDGSFRAQAARYVSANSDAEEGRS